MNFSKEIFLKIYYALPLLIWLLVGIPTCTNPPKKSVPKPEKPAIIDGCISGNCVDGFGTKDYPNGDKYIGEFVNSQPQGNGRLQFSNNEVYSGEFQNGKPHGYGTLYDKDKKMLYTGNWISGNKEK